MGSLHVGNVLRVACALLILVVLSGSASAQLSADGIAALRARGQSEGWTFTVGPNGATDRPLSELCGLVEPDNWKATARFDPCTPRRELPAIFDWRDYGCCPPVRNQRNCGSCWAFATAGALECNILIKDHIEADLSEQWLVSCNQDGWGCHGGWWAHDYHWWKADPCGGTGAVPETAFAYQAQDRPCDCPYEHEYLLDGWAYVGDGSSIPPDAAIKQAILDHGPVTVGVYVESSFQAYTGGIFNNDTDGAVNHGVVLIGWNDPEQYWVLRNSWGPNWGEGGYMRIRYGCARIGFAACYIDYSFFDCNLNQVPDACDLDCGPAGGPCDLPGCGGSADCAGDGIPDECEPDCNANGQADSCDVLYGDSPDCNTNGIPDECDLASCPPNKPACRDCNVNGVLDGCDLASQTSLDCNKNFVPDECDIAGGFSSDCQPNGIPDECDLFPPEDVPAADSCADAQLVCPNIVYYGSTAGATNDGSATCGNSGISPDVWYYYRCKNAGLLKVSLAGSEYDTVLSVHRGCPGTTANQAACNDNFFGLQSYVQLNVNPANEYWIRISGAAGASGTFRMSLTGPPCTYTGECNNNGVPDECEPDCNANGRPDDCDLAGGISPDCNANAIPDECDIGGGSSSDLNATGMPDECEGLGDLNCDGAADDLDISAFVLALIDPPGYESLFPACQRERADINGDGAVDGFDIQPFVMLLTWD